MISLRAVISGKTVFLVLKDWSLKPLYQYCWFWRGSEGSQKPSVIFVINEERMVAVVGAAEAADPQGAHEAFEVPLHIAVPPYPW